MIKYNNDVIFSFIYSCCLFYTPSKINKRQIKHLFYSFPFFLSTMNDKKIMFEIIKKYPITCYDDTSENMIDYSYIIYKDYHKKTNKKFLLKNEYISHYTNSLKDTKEYNQIYYKIKLNNILFFILILIFFYFIYAY